MARNPIISRGTRFLKKPERQANTSQVAKHLHVTMETVRRWVRTSDVPHDVRVGAKSAEKIAAGLLPLEKALPKTLLFDPEEVRLWYISQQSQGKRLPRHTRIPLPEARRRLKAVKEQLKLTTDQFAKALGIKRSTLTGYLFGRRDRKLSAVPKSIVLNAEALAFEDAPITLRRMPASMIKNAIIINKGHLANAANSLEMHPRTLKKLAIQYGFDHLLRGKPDYSSKITKSQLISSLKRHDAHVKSVAAELRLELEI